MSSEESTVTISTDQDKKQEPFTPKIIGIYGLPGAGKSTILNELRKKLGEEEYLLVDGSDLLFGRESEDRPVVPPNFEQPSGAEQHAFGDKHLTIDEAKQAFKRLSKPEQDTKRRQAIQHLQQRCKSTRKHAVVAGHYMFWVDEHSQEQEIVWTEKDAELYTHMQRCHQDEKRDRPVLEIAHLNVWQQEELRGLRTACYASEIPFVVVKDGEKAKAFVEDFLVSHDAATCEQRAFDDFQQRFDELNSTTSGTILVFDADNTLSACDAGAMLYKSIGGNDGMLKDVFKSSLGYSASAFYQAMLFFEEALGRKDWDLACEKIASQINIYFALTDLLRVAAKRNNVGVAVLTCGISKVWERVLEQHGLNDSVTIIGGGRLKDQCVVTPMVKQRIVEYFQTEKNAFVWAFGDSEVDLTMLEQADQAVIVVCDENIRSKSMDEKLTKSLTKNDLFARQLLLPSTVTPRLNGRILPVVHPADSAFETGLAEPFQFIHATSGPASKLLARLTRNKQVTGLALQAAHRRVGYFLAQELLPKATGPEKYPMTSVQMDPTKAPSQGYRIRNEDKTIIISCMRGGDHLAQGIFEALSSAIYVHAHKAKDLDDDKHRQAIVDAKNILICDFVINQGSTMIEFVEKIRSELKNRTARIVMMAGVTFAGCIRGDGGLVKGLKGHWNVGLVALRLSENSFKPPGDGADTGGGCSTRVVDAQQEGLQGLPEIG